MPHPTRPSFLCSLGVLLALISLVLSQTVSNEQKMFTALYKGVEEMVVPTYRGVDSAPIQVILFEMPGLAINRAEYDPLLWSAGGFDARQPDAVAAGFVDRLPYYTGPTFVDSGSFITSIWSNFIYQYIIPIVDDPIQTKKVNDARLALANGTLENAYNTASDDYQAAFNALTTFRSDCLAKQTGAGGGVCSAEGVIYRERLKRKWFTLEVARRDIAAAEAKIIALQIQDLKNIFADALYSFASSERVDMGASGFGQSYYLTYFTPSNFWRWWPSAGIFDYSVYADGSIVVIPIPSGSTLFQPPINGFMTDLGNGSYSYRPNAGYTGTDRLGYQTPIPGPGNATTTTFKSIQVVGTDVTIANTAFVQVSTSAGSSSFSSSSFSSSFSTSSSFSAGVGWFSASGSLSTSNSAATSATDSVSSSTSLAFDLARVSITRPWLDTSLLSFYPVAIRNLAAQGWSDGTLTPPSGPLQFKFKLLPTSFLVARNVLITTTFSQAMTSLVTAASSLQASLRVSFGPFFSGSTSVSQSSSSRDYQESSQYSNGALSIRGPQVIGWLCTAIPPFPTAAEDDVRKWEADQVKRQEDIQNGNVSSSS